MRVLVQKTKKYRTNGRRKDYLVCEELNQELGNGRKLAEQLALHLESMGAGQCEIPITTDDGCYLIKITKTL